jgi:hypothetical protein
LRSTVTGIDELERIDGAPPNGGLPKASKVGYNEE